jgi:DNA-binding NtrC family response regulator
MYSRVLVVDDEQIIRDSSRAVLEKERYIVDTVATGEELLRNITTYYYDVILLDLILHDMQGIDILKEVKQLNPEQLIVIMTGYPSIETAVEAMKLGAADYIAKPFSPEELRLLVKRTLEKKKLKNENELLRRQLESRCNHELVTGPSKSIRAVMSIIERVAPTDCTVLITGESGTGKELFAREIHRRSMRHNREFVPVDCSALVESLMESELFGHVKGSFTGAIETKHGFFDLANGGTFFFDEISNLSLNIQAKLLRVLQEREIKRVGGLQRIKVDVRVIAATNQDLREAVNRKLFREDLYYRLSVVPISLPPLRERIEDIPLLVQHFIKKYNRRRREVITGIETGALDVLQKYPWPGNIRELENTIERAMVLEEGPRITCESLPWHVRTNEEAFLNQIIATGCKLRDMEKKYIKKVLEQHCWNKNQAAQILGIDRKTLYQKIARYNLAPDR